jgi:hypothetical protein
MFESPEANFPLPHLPLAAGTRHAPRPLRVLRRLHRLSGRDPDRWLIAGAAAGWVFLIAAPRAHAGHGAAHPGTGSKPVALAAMVVAMMLPLTLGRVRALARSRPWRPNRAAAEFLAGYLALWMLAILFIDVAWMWAASRVGPTAAAVIVIGAAVPWEFASAALRRAEGSGARPLTERGWRADVECVRRGVVSAGDCVASCWALMAACVAFAHSLPVMVALFCVQVYGRHREPAFPALSALAVLGVCAAALAVRLAGHHAM